MGGQNFEILGSKVPSRYIKHRVNSRRGIAGQSRYTLYVGHNSRHMYLELHKIDKKKKKKKKKKLYRI